MSQPVISVIIPHYGDVEPTARLVAELLTQAGAPRIEIIVSDDNSPQTFPDGAGYQVVRSQINGGYGTACNRGAEIASGDLLLFLNSDLRIGSSFITDFYAAAEPKLPAVVAPRVREGGGQNHVPRRFPLVRHYVIEWLLVLARFEPKMWWQGAIGHDIAALVSEVPVTTDWLTGVVHMMPAADYRAVGGFDERYFMNCEETDLHRRLRLLRALPAVYLPQIEVDHEGGGSSDPQRRAGWLVDSRFKYAHKWGGARRLRVGLVAASWANFLWNLMRKVRGTAVSPVMVLGEQLDLINHGWRQRAGRSAS